MVLVKACQHCLGALQTSRQQQQQQQQVSWGYATTKQRQGVQQLTTPSLLHDIALYQMMWRALQL
jgi:hypothetical protein